MRVARQGGERSSCRATSCRGKRTWRRRIAQDALAETALRGVPPSELREAAAQLLRKGRRDNTWVTYNNAQRRFVAFCAANHLQAVPAALSTILLYLAFLFRENLVHFSSIPVYLTAINALHKDLGFDPPAVGSFVQLAKKGFEELDADRNPELRDRSTALPASVMADILALGLEPGQTTETLRACAFLVTNYCFFARADTGVRARPADFARTARGIEFREEAKNLPRWRPVTMVLPQTRDNQLVFLLFDRFLDRQQWVGRWGNQFWSLSSDRTALTVSHVTRWLDQCLDRLGAHPPLGELWTRHSLRRGGATAALAIGVDVPTILRWGVWRSLPSVQAYLDPLVPDSLEARLFFGHLRREGPPPQPVLVVPSPVPSPPSSP